MGDRKLRVDRSKLRPRIWRRVVTMVQALNAEVGKGKQ